MPWQHDAGWKPGLGIALSILVLATQANPEIKPKLKRTGNAKCPCLDYLPALVNITVNTNTNQNNRWSFSRQRRDPVDDCLVASNIDRLQRPGEKYCYPVDYGRGRCESWDERLLPECAEWQGKGRTKDADVNTPEECKGMYLARQQPKCAEIVKPKVIPLPWCGVPWCYVDPNNCELDYSPSYYFPGRDIWYSYDTCDSSNYFVVWGAAQLDMCERFEVVEKPHAIMWLSCCVCAFMQQLIDATRLCAEHKDRISNGQRVYMGFQLLVLVTETFANFKRIPWLEGDFWSNYNLYVYVFINSSVFVRATMMSQIVWDWHQTHLLKYAVLLFDGKGWTEGARASLLVLIFQFMSSLGIFGVISITHLLPALFVYHWIFLIVATVLVKSRMWVAQLGLDPEGRNGRALVMGTNSFMSCMGIQMLVTCMVRAYAGEWRGGYLAPLRNDFLSRRLDVWYACHLGKGISAKLFLDQDFINLFLR